jgi:hypothetical protein
MNPGIPDNYLQAEKTFRTETYQPPVIRPITGWLKNNIEKVPGK